MPCQNRPKLAAKACKTSWLAVFEKIDSLFGGTFFYSFSNSAKRRRNFVFFLWQGSWANCSSADSSSTMSCSPFALFSMVASSSFLFAVLCFSVCQSGCLSLNIFLKHYFFRGELQKYCHLGENVKIVTFLVPECPECLECLSA